MFPLSLRAAIRTRDRGGRLRKRVPERGGAAAHNGPRRIEARPSASAIVRAAGPGAAHTWDNVVTEAVFHAPMLTLNTDAE